MKLTVSNWLKHTDIKKDVIPTLVAFSIVTATWLVNRKNHVRYTAHMHPFKAPETSVMTMPGIYVTKTNKEEIHNETDEGTRSTTRKKPGTDEPYRLPAPQDDVPGMETDARPE